jgi:sugar (pentulose or hexulose) kinase
VTLLGNVLIAGRAIGIYDDLKTAGEAFIRTERTFRPDPGRTKTYGKYYELYLRLIESNRKIYQDLSN